MRGLGDILLVIVFLVVVVLVALVLLGTPTGGLG